ncbi:hypothetical protein LXL04_029559 [Taraxacum kok-saghyz]
MEQDDSGNMDRKGKGKMTDDSDKGNPIAVLKGSSSSSVQENESAPAANVPIATTVAEEPVCPPPDLIQPTSSTPNRRPARRLYHCQFCEASAYELPWMQQHEERHRMNAALSQQIPEGMRPRRYYTWDTRPMMIPSLQYVLGAGLGYAYGGGGCSRAVTSQPLNDFNHYPPVARAGRPPRPPFAQPCRPPRPPVAQAGRPPRPPVAQAGLPPRPPVAQRGRPPRPPFAESGRPLQRRRLNTNLSLALPQAEPDTNDGSIDFLSRIGISRSRRLQNQRNRQDQDQDHNNDEDVDVIDLTL